MVASTPTSSNTSSALNTKTLTDAGKTSLALGLATGLAVFAVQAAVVAGKSVFVDGKNILSSIRS